MYKNDRMSASSRQPKSKRMAVSGSGAFVLSTLLALGAASGANAKSFKVKQYSGYYNVYLDFQAASFDDGRANTPTSASNVDWTVRFNLERRMDNGWLAGLRVEVDQNFDADTDRASNANNVRVDEIYGFVSSRFGRVEAGEQDGPADSLALYAPILGTGQIFGDFARYASGQARLKPFDSRDALKFIYLAPPIGGLRLGVSWGPHLRIDRKDPVLTRRTIQRDPVELGAQYQTPLGDKMVWALSGGYTRASAAPETQRQNIDSWSVGTNLSRNKLRFGGAYVSRGDSNSFLGRNEKEINAGISWRERKWSIATSYARITRSTLHRDLFGSGAKVKINRYVDLRTDLVFFNDRFTSGTRRKGVVGLIDMRLHY
jgi:Gram-negative porin